MSEQDYSAKGDAYFAFARSEVLPLLPKMIGCIADVGGSSGATLSLIKKSHPMARTICVDGYAPAVEVAASQGHEALCCDLEGPPPPILRDCDVVMFLDVLEHLKDPWRVLAGIVENLKTGSTVIVSLPNVRYLPVSWGLFVRGTWTLQDAGVLDRTHLRFFTRNSGRQLLEQAGLIVHASMGKLPGGRKYGLMNVLTAGLFRDLLNVQYIFAAKKPSP